MGNLIECNLYILRFY